MAVPQTTSNLKTANGISAFFREVKTEMKKVTWATKQELIMYTIVVIVAVFFVAALIWAIDTIFAHVIRLLLGV